MKLRESLESQVMAMAEAVKKLFEDTLYYSNGDHVKVVIADSTHRPRARNPLPAPKSSAEKACP